MYLIYIEFEYTKNKTILFSELNLFYIILPINIIVILNMYFFLYINYKQTKLYAVFFN